MSLCHKYLWSFLVIGLFQYGEDALFDGGHISESAAVRLRDDPTGPCSDDPNESDQSELSLTLLRTPIVRSGGKDSDAPTKET